MEMEKRFEGRTDLALEASECLKESGGTGEGIVVEENYDREEKLRVTSVRIMTGEAEKAVGKPRGTYITLESVELLYADEDYHRDISKELAKVMRKLLQEKEQQSVLVVGLGNADVTPDALGPMVAGNLCINRHWKQKGKRISAIVPGVMAQTGMETAEIVRGIVQETKPTAVIAVDALAARSTKRLNTTIQIADTGIHPGSGVGNHRHGLTKESLGVPVLAIGVPTVVDAASIVSDAMGQLLTEMEEIDKRRLVEGMLDERLKNLFVTPKDIDETVKHISYTISEAINMAFCEESNELEHI